MTHDLIEDAMAFQDLPAAPVDCSEVDAAVRRLTEESLRREIVRRGDDFLADREDWGEDGRVDYKELDEYAIASWVADLLDRQREAITEAVLRALPE